MKKILLIAFCLFIVRTSFAQFYEQVDINNLTLKVDAEGFFPYDPLEFKPALIVPNDLPKELGTSGTIFTASLWIGGLDASDEIHVAANTYKDAGQDFWSGPIGLDYTSSAYLDKYENVFLVNKETIDDHILHFEDAGYSVPTSLLNWPGNGDVFNGEAEQLAPYFDYNVNNIYDPENGDYPIIRGDEAAFVIFNDARESHTETGGEAFGIEVHAMIYAYSDAENIDLWNTTFVHYEIFNRSLSNFSDVYVGFFSDFDIGCYSDDYVGCDSSTNLFYGYNGNAIDEACSGNYETLVPAQGIMFLNEKMQSFTYYNNDFTVTGNPNLPQHYYQYLQSIWIDETPVTYGGSGFGGTDAFPYMFPDQPGNSDGWSMLSELLPPADRRGLGAIGPKILQINESICLDMAFPFAITDSIEDAGLEFTYQGDAVTELIKRAGSIQTFYDETFTTCKIENIMNEDTIIEDTTDFIPEVLLQKIVVYPNPVSSVIHIQLPFFEEGLELFIYNAIGDLYMNKKIDNAHIEIQVSDLPAGVYQYEILQQKEQLLIERFIKE